MKIIILAAGKGSRLNRSTPKPLTLLANGKSILQMQLDNFLRYFKKDSIYIVIGYQKEKFYAEYKDYTFIENLNYAEENTSKSLLKALMYTGLDDVIWVNGDVVFHPSVFDRLLLKNQCTMVVNVGKTGEEEVKYTLDSEGKINAVSKLLNQAKGESLGINLVTQKELSKLIQGLKNCMNDDYFEKGIEYAIEEGASIYPLFVNTEDCIEIDFPEDILRANNLLNLWKHRK